MKEAGSLRAGLVKKTFKKSNIWARFGRMDGIEFSRGEGIQAAGAVVYKVCREGACV